MGGKLLRKECGTYLGAFGESQRSSAIRTRERARFLFD